MPSPRYVGKETQKTPLILSRLNTVQIEKISDDRKRRLLEFYFQDKKKKQDFVSDLGNKVRRAQFNRVEGSLAQFDRTQPAKQGNVIPLDENNKIPFDKIENTGNGFKVVHVCPQNVWKPSAVLDSDGSKIHIGTWEIPATHRPNVLVFEGVAGLGKNDGTKMQIQVCLSETPGKSVYAPTVSHVHFGHHENVGIYPFMPVDLNVSTGKMYANLVINPKGYKGKIVLSKYFYLTCTEYPAF